MQQTMILSALLLIAIVAVNESMAQARKLVKSTIYLESVSKSCVCLVMFNKTDSRRLSVIDQL